jgi:hypothetical protein
VIKRYNETVSGRGGLKTANSVANIRRAIRSGNLSYTEAILKDGERIDMIAAKNYGDARLWWVIAAASNIGWWMQVPEGTLVRIPSDISQVMGIL